MKVLWGCLFILCSFGYAQSPQISINNAPDWVVIPTSINHTIAIPGNSTFFGSTLVPDGSFVGLFYDSVGVERCAGIVELTSSNLAMTAYGAEMNQDNGYQVGDSFVWRLWHADYQSEYPLIAVYDTSLVFPNQGLFAIDGISKMLSLSVNNLNIQSIEYSEINIWPIPVVDELNFSSTNFYNGRLSIFDLNGVEVFRKTTIVKENATQAIDINYLNKGLYLLKLDHYNVKFIKD